MKILIVHFLIALIAFLDFNKAAAQNTAPQIPKPVKKNTKLWVAHKEQQSPIEIIDTLTGKKLTVGDTSIAIMLLHKQGFYTDFTKPFLHEVLSIDKYFSQIPLRQNIYTISNLLTIRNCEYHNNSNFKDMVWNISSYYHFKSHVRFDTFKSNCILFFSNMSFEKGLSIDHSSLYKLNVHNSKGDLNIWNTKLQEKIFIQNSDLKLSLYNILNSLSDTLEIEIISSKINSFTFNNIINFDTAYLPEYVDIEFINDTINGQFFLFEKESTKKTKSITFRFADCHINSQFNVTNFNRSSIIFENCTFGPLADMSNMNISRIEFKECIDLPNKFKLKSKSKNDKNTTTLLLKNTDISKLNFDYSDNFRLEFDTQAPMNFDESVNSTYEILINKFKNEGKTTSYQKLKIEHKQYLYSIQGPVGHFKNIIDRYWWYYGFKKFYIFFWSFFLLILFTIINYFYWPEMQITYPSKDEKKVSYYDSKQIVSFQLKKITTTFIYTAFIFFSLKIDFNNLKMHKTTFLALFFLQYLTGVICMFFIINAIFKFE